MANIYNLEPQAFGSVTFVTTFGKLDIELFTKQCPKATKNFVQLCLDGYYVGTVFSRVEKDFIAVGGRQEDNFDQNERKDDYFPDEFHSRLKFSRRGLLATANTEKDKNGPEFFFTLGPTPELQNKHTIFGRVSGNSVYNLLELNDCQVDEDFLPSSEHKILSVHVIDNPFSDIAPRQSIKLKPEPSKTEDENSSPDYEDPLMKPKTELHKSKKLSFYPSEDEDDNDYLGDTIPKSEIFSPKASLVVKNDLRNDLKEDNERSPQTTPDMRFEKEDDDKNIVSEPLQTDDGVAAKEKKLREIRAQIAKIKQQIEHGSTTKTLSEKRNSTNDRDSRSQTAVDPQCDTEISNLRLASKKSRHRQRETIELVTNFKKKLKETTTSESTTSRDSHISPRENFDEELVDELASLERVDGDDWLRHKFEVDDEIRSGVDANVTDDWYFDGDTKQHKVHVHRRDKHHQRSIDRRHDRR